jgi:hypothetical protein
VSPYRGQHFAEDGVAFQAEQFTGPIFGSGLFFGIKWKWMVIINLWDSGRNEFIFVLKYFLNKVNRFQMSISESIAGGVVSTKTRLLIFAFLLALLILMPFLIHSQWITGPTVNAALFIAAVILGPSRAILLGLMPSTIALGSGLLPFVLAPMVPFIMLGNVILVLAFYYLYKRNYFLALGVASFLKFAFLHQTVTWIMSRYLEQKFVGVLSVMMSWPQFFTAVVGGLVAYAFLKPIKKV